MGEPGIRLQPGPLAASEAQPQTGQSRDALLSQMQGTQLRRIDDAPDEEQGAGLEVADGEDEGAIGGDREGLARHALRRHHHGGGGLGRDAPSSKCAASARRAG